ncbi:non-canonical purine NTP diphosphatase [Psychroflexus aestuariivivens]|uniref:non-canonical purine NTP diphosphatase n=1 Tax=Psychroflexus aestuariivivens TaxID=1795040 RepID=UPI000FDA44C9|nr:non-canonical purine NTP diphosphatase [Psychroflexus aestuariivivens]
MKLIFATHNPNKVEEIRQIMPSYIQLLSLSDIDFHEEIEETGNTIEDNAKIKAEVISKKFEIPCFADDTGLEVDALNGEPGVKSARYAGEEKNDSANRKKLLENLKDKTQRSARFKTVISYIDGKLEKTFTGICEGEITEKPSGNGGFGYDPIFKPSSKNQTFAEMSAEEKNSISHRALAFQKMLEFLRNQNKSNS